MKNNKYTYGQLVRAGQADTMERTADFILSTPAKDRHGTVLNQDGWQLENYQNNPVVGYQHNVYGGDLCNGPNPDDVIGKSQVFVEDGRLIGRVSFEPAEINPMAEKIYQKVLFGTLRTASVGFTEVGQGRFGEGEQARGAKDETYYFEGQELLEWSIVNIPSNPEAVVKTVRSQQATILQNIKRYLGRNYAEIENMRVKEVFALMENRLPTRQLQEHKETFLGLSEEARTREIFLLNI